MEWKISELVDIAIENIQNKTQREKRLKKLTEHERDAGQLQAGYVHVIEAADGAKKGKKIEKYFF